MARMNSMTLCDDEVLYIQNQYPDEIYFIGTGRINLIIQDLDVMYKSFLRYSHIGEVEIIKKCLRLDTAKSFGYCALGVLSKAVKFIQDF